MASSADLPPTAWLEFMVTTMREVLEDMLADLRLGRLRGIFLRHNSESLIPEWFFEAAHRAVTEGIGARTSEPLSLAVDASDAGIRLAAALAPALTSLTLRHPAYGIEFSADLPDDMALPRLEELYLVSCCSSPSERFISFEARTEKRRDQDCCMLEWAGPLAIGRTSAGRLRTVACVCLQPESATRGNAIREALKSAGQDGCCKFLFTDMGGRRITRSTSNGGDGPCRGGALAWSGFGFFETEMEVDCCVQRNGAGAGQEEEEEDTLPALLRLNDRVPNPSLILAVAEQQRKHEEGGTTIRSATLGLVSDEGQETAAQFIRRLPWLEGLSLHWDLKIWLLSQSLHRALLDNRHLRRLHDNRDPPLTTKVVCAVNASRRREALDLAAWRVVLAGMLAVRERRLASGLRMTGLLRLPWHSYSLAGRVSGFVGDEPPRIEFEI